MKSQLISNTTFYIDTLCTICISCSPVVIGLYVPNSSKSGKHFEI